MKNLIIELFSVISRTLNVLSGGSADITLSARAHRDQIGWLEASIDTVFYLLFREENHCGRWWIIEVERSKRNIEDAKRLRTIE